MPGPFPPIRFKGELRPSQRDALEIARRKLAAGQRTLHIVAPPGSGKTVLGLYLWAECVRLPALVLSPNSAIQAQWVAKTGLFGLEDAGRPEISADPRAPGLLTSLTYQSVTLPQRGGEDLDAQALLLWQERLVEKGQAKDLDEATAWIDDLQRHNRGYYEDRLAVYRKELRDAASLGGEAMKTLHASSLATLERLRQRDIGLIVLDECHHLLSHWGRVLAEIHRYFDHPIVAGLTATPPDRRGKPPADVERYDAFFGPVDYDVPVPAVVKDGFLAPYQDLVQFVRPTRDELEFIGSADRQLQEFVEELCREPPASTASTATTDLPSVGAVAARADRLKSGKALGREPLPRWLTRVLAERLLPVGVASDWEAFERRDPVFADAARRFLTARGLSLPPGVPPNSSAEAATPGALDMSLLVPVLDRFVRHRLRSSADPADHELAERAIARLRLLGVQVTETGTQVCASPVGRVLMYGGGKVAALLPILRAERRALGDRIRAVIVADFEKTSAVAAEVGHLLNEEAGGAMAAFRALLRDPESDELQPVLVTGSSVLIDDDLAPRFVESAAAWLNAKRLDVKLSLDEEQGFRVLIGQGADWCPRVYVALITDLFQQGVSKCLVGTRGLLGEGWDADKVNVLIDLTTVTTSTSVNQLRGRSFRLDPQDPVKLADNWDVVCLAPEFVKGLDDYGRFIDKHDTLFGLTDDGVVEKGVGHVHAAFTQIKPEGIEDSMALLNAEMLERPFRRAVFRQLWRIGEPFHREPIHAVEARLGGGGGFPPFAGVKLSWNERSLTTAIATAIVAALRETGLVRGPGDLQIGERAGGYVRAFLKGADEAEGELFAAALCEALGPLAEPRYVVPRYVDLRNESWLSRILPQVLGRYFRQSRRIVRMLHAVPSALARNKDLATVYQLHWNRHVSPGEVLYAQRGEGEDLVAQARRSGKVPKGHVHRKEVFL